MEQLAVQTKQSSLNQVLLLIVATTLVWAGVFYPTIESAVLIWQRSDTFAHCFLILPISAYLIWQKQQVLSYTQSKPNFWVSIPIVLVLFIWLLGITSTTLALEQLAAFTILPLMIWLVIGNQAVKHIWFPLCYILFSVPIGEFLIPQLQNITADITVFSLQLTNIPVYREALYIAIPGGLFEVAVACSGIRYLIASAALGTLYAYLTYNKLHKQIIFIVFATLLPIIANGIRAYGIVMIAHLSDMKYATGVDHLIYGWIFFGIVIFIMFWVGNIWRDNFDIIGHPDIDKNKTTTSKSHIVAITASIIVGACIAMYAKLLTTPMSPPSAHFSHIRSHEVNLHPDMWTSTFKNASKQLMGEQQDFSFYLAYYQGNSQTQELINAQNRHYNQSRWAFAAKHQLTVNLEGKAHTLPAIEIATISGDRRLVSYFFYTRSILSSNSLEVKLRQAFDRILTLPEDGLYFSGSVAINSAASNAESISQAKAQLATYMQNSFNTLAKPVLYHDES
ncbi:exosortase A [Flocculibacter collagenilyticus]|uniref:exosortase A n=1 Tax=Flocculibacter collagenilyticus TaxID=2744479 RepID=UPI0018F6C0E2|nr:exosortase A [Flocculibacter collagenilyticus]